MTTPMIIEPEVIDGECVRVNEWEQEENEYEFVSHGYDCYIWRNPELKFLCGYVRLPDGHPALQFTCDKPTGLSGMEYDYNKLDVNIHGGVTFFGHLNVQKKDGVWVGFDCGHAYDYTPGFAEILKKIGSNRVWGLDEIYRNVDYVKDECSELARQLKEMETKALVAPDSKE